MNKENCSKKTLILLEHRLYIDEETFLLNVERLTPYIKWEKTALRPLIAVDERVAMASYRCGTGDSSQTISWPFTLTGSRGCCHLAMCNEQWACIEKAGSQTVADFLHMHR